MTGVTCKAGNAYSSGAPDFTFVLEVHVVPLFFTYFANVSGHFNDFWFWLL